VVEAAVVVEGVAVSSEAQPARATSAARAAIPTRPARSSIKGC